ncbi:MAG: PA2169 family four-helix-bundle protein [Alphaproteobacteria bacterium]|nr:PA2169 family four-helix-bundle protein [Alphaproteobacteria bacterium]
MLKAGESFYRKAADNVDDHALKKLFSEHAAIRNAAVTEMSQKVERSDEDPSGASWTEQARQGYANAESMFNGTDALIEYLEEHEDRTLEQIREALKGVEDREAVKILTRHLAIFQQTHDRMKAVKDTHNS